AEEMDELYRAAGHDPSTKRKTIFIWGSVLGDHESYDSDRVLAQTGPFAAQVLHAVMETMDRGVDASGGTDEAAAADESPIGRHARLEVLDRIEEQIGDAHVRRRGAGLAAAQPAVDADALEPVAEAIGHHRNVLGDVVVVIERGAFATGVQDADLDHDSFLPN